MRGRRTKLWPTLIITVGGKGWPKAVQNETFASRLTGVGERRTEVFQQIARFVVDRGATARRPVQTEHVVREEILLGTGQTAVEGEGRLRLSRWGGFTEFAA